MISKSEAAAEVQRKPVVEVDENRKWRVVCRSAEIEPGGMRPFKVAGRRVVVARLEDRTLRAVANTCPHEAARMSDGKVERMWHGDGVGESRQNGRCVIVCPWHNFEFDLDTGESPCEPGRMRLKTYRVGEIDGEVFIRV